MTSLEETVLDLLRKSGYARPRYFSNRGQRQAARNLCATGLAEENPTRRGEFRIIDAGGRTVLRCMKIVGRKPCGAPARDIVCFVDERPVHLCAVHRPVDGSLHNVRRENLVHRREPVDRVRRDMEMMAAKCGSNAAIG